LLHEKRYKHTLDITSEELINLQCTDKALKCVHDAADKHPATEGVGFYFKDGLLYLRWIPPNREGSMAVERLVLPLKYHKTVLKLEIPLSGHLGKEKTSKRVLQRFYWPTLHRDVSEFCKTCSTCLKASRYKGKQAPLIPLPIIDVPFKRIAMDLVGPLPRSQSGNRYILVVCDYATRYPEVVAIKSIEAGRITEELIYLQGLGCRRKS